MKNKLKFLQSAIRKQAAILTPCANSMESEKRKDNISFAAVTLKY